MTAQSNLDSMANLELVDFQGQSRTLADWLGHKHVVLVFNRGFF